MARNTESLALTIVAVVASLLLALVVWLGRWPRLALLCVARQGKVCGVLLADPQPLVPDGRRPSLRRPGELPEPEAPAQRKHGPRRTAQDLPRRPLPRQPWWEHPYARLRQADHGWTLSLPIPTLWGQVHGDSVREGLPDRQQGGPSSRVLSSERDARNRCRHRRPPPWPRCSELIGPTPPGRHRRCPAGRRRACRSSR